MEITLSRLYKQLRHVLAAILIGFTTIPVVAQAGEPTAEEINAILSDAEVTLSKLSVEEIDKTLKIIDQERDQHELNQIKDQNTLLYQSGKLPIGFYKGDIIRGAALATSFAADHYMMKAISNFRSSEIVKNIDEILELSQQIEELTNNAEEEFKKEYDQKGFLSRLFSAQTFHQGWLDNKIRNLIQQHITSRSTTIGKNPFKLPLVKAILSNIALHEASNGMMNVYLNKSMRITQLQAFKKNENNELVPVTNKHGNPAIPPPSIISILALLISQPAILYATLPTNNDDQSVAKIINESLQLNLPSFLFSRGANAAWRLLTYGLTIKRIDTLISNHWAQFFVTNWPEISQLAQSLKDKRDTNEDTDQIIQEITSLVEKGQNTIGGVQWASSQWNSTTITTILSGMPIVAALALKYVRSA